MKSIIFLLLIGAAVLGQRRLYHKVCHREKCHRASPKPEFLRKVGSKARYEYFQIVWNTKETFAKIDEEVLRWAKNNGVVEQVKEFSNNKARFIEELKQNVTNLIAELPAALRVFLNITQNKDQSRPEMHKALKEMRAQKFEVFDAVTAAFKVFRPRHCLHRGYRGCVSSEELMDEWVKGHSEEEESMEVLDPYE